MARIPKRLRDLFDKMTDGDPNKEPDFNKLTVDEFIEVAEFVGLEGGKPEKGKRKGKIPEGCAACGGPYPDCMSSCSLFDD